MDDTIELSKGEKIKAKGIYRDERLLDKSGQQILLKPLVGSEKSKNTAVHFCPRDPFRESGAGFVNALYELKLDFAVAIRSNHAVWLPQGQTVRHNRWRKFERVFSNGKTELRYIP